MIPQLYFIDDEGLLLARVGGLHQAISCVVSQTVNGAYEMNLTIPVSADHAGQISLGKGITAIPDGDPDTEPETFIVDRTRKGLRGLLSVHAVHRSYMLNNNMVTPFLNNGVARGPQWAFSMMVSNMVNPPIGFSLVYALSSTATGGPHLLVPKSVRAYLLEDLVLDWGGELRIRGGEVRWMDNVGEDRGARITYAGNLLSMEIERQQTYETAIYPYYGRAGDTNRPLVEISGKILSYGISAPLEKIIPVDLSSKFESAPTQAQLLAEANRYKNARRSARLSESLNLEKVTDRGEVPIRLGDTVQIYCTPAGINESRRVMRMSFDAVREKVTGLAVGEKMPTLADTILSMKA